jgi:hypothetical protein
MRRRKLDMERAFFNENSPGNNAGRLSIGLQGKKGDG